MGRHDAMPLVGMAWDAISRACGCLFTCVRSPVCVCIVLYISNYELPPRLTYMMDELHLRMGVVYVCAFYGWSLGRAEKEKKKKKKKKK